MKVPVAAPTPLTAHSAIEAGAGSFAGYLEQTGVSRQTKRAYALDVNQLCRFLHTCIAGPTLSSVDAGAIRLFVDHLHSCGLRPRTIARKLTSVRALYEHLRQLGLSDGSPVRGVSPPTDTARPVGLSALQMRTLLGLPERSSFIGSRDRALMELLYGCGLRLEELLPLQLSHLLLTDMQLHVEGARPRTLPLGRSTIRTLTHYLQMRAELLSQRDIQQIDAGALFVSRRGRRLRTRTAQQAMERYILRLEGADTQWGMTHRPRRGATALRAAFAEHLLAAGADAGGVGRLMGRARSPVPASTDLEALQQRYQQAHPRAQGADPPDSASRSTP
ncbi:MAG: tyrosine-type recombinase/integrase [Gemmatimonadetes bacterium]|jgi:integrase/recombinase XerC|nr:tyrosine-type recombinase/integrase [Gemmatimonadota bacterium]